MTFNHFIFCLVLIMSISHPLGAQSKEELVSVQGQTSDLLGYPLEAVTLKFYARSWYQPCTDARLLKTVITDHEGKYEISDLPYGYYDIFAEVRGFRATEVSRVYFSKGNNLLDIGLPVGLLHDVPLIKFEGTVRRSDKTPVENATVIVMSAFNPQIIYRARTDKNGGYKITTYTSSQYIIYATKEGYAASTSSSSAKGGRIDFSLSAFSR